MAENKGYMTLSDEQGSIHISEEVIAAIAVGAVREVEGVSGMMGNLGTSVADLVTNKKGAQKNAKGVKIEMTETGLVLDIYLTVAYGHAIPEVAENAQKRTREAMTRNTAREIAAHLSYELSFTDKTVEELLQERLTSEAFAELAEEDSLYTEAPNAKQVAYITRLVTGVNEHAAELDGYIAKYAKNWKFSRIPLVASAIMRVAMYEILYMQDIPNGAAINEAVEIAKKYETPETVKFINGILGSFAREEISQ